jgi:hypothetical protein
MAGPLQPESLLDMQARDRNRRATLSPHLQRRLTVLEKLQAKLRPEDKLHTRADPRVQLALEAVEDAFNEISSFKEHCAELSSKHLKMTCAQVQSLQVLGFDY